jgi:hypothetical protein
LIPKPIVFLFQVTICPLTIRGSQAVAVWVKRDTVNVAEKNMMLSKVFLSSELQYTQNIHTMIIGRQDEFSK